MQAAEDDKTLHQRALMHSGLCERDFLRLSSLICSECGIKMPPSKKIMLEARLRTRLRELGISSFRDYCEYLFSRDGRKREIVPIIDVVTTNKTDFFREPRHFDYLIQTALPELQKTRGAGFNRDLAIWSAGCSTGEEPYTIAMVLNEFKEERPAFRFIILATDISTRVLERAISGIYKQERAETIPVTMKKKYLLRSKDRERGLVRVAPELRTQVKFRRLNFMEEDFGMLEPMDIIFCRNVIIYFDRPTQEKLVNRLCSHLAPGGYLFMGHAETLSGLHVPLISTGPMIYRKSL
jgi:chemotaxis protein methyltransferase CheR